MKTVVGYHRPGSLEEALSLLNREGTRSVLVAGGTSLNASRMAESVEIIDLQAIGCDQIRFDGTTLEIGATVRLTDLAAHQSVPKLVRDLTKREGPNTLRNVATVGGTIATGNAESELLAGLLVFDGLLTLAGPGGATESVPLDELLADRSKLAGCIIVAIHIQTDGSAAAARTGRTPADTSIVAAVGRRSTSGMRLSVTGMAETPILVEPEGVADLDPPGDFRGSPRYRRHLAGTLVRRVIDQLGESA